MNKLNLIMPMAGAGSRFFKNGFIVPKPLIEIEGKPFFFWATQSIAKFVELESITFVVLKQHVEEFQIDQRIKAYYPDAIIVEIPEVLNGAVLTCLEGLSHLPENQSILFNDCDHLFYSKAFYEFIENADESVDGALLTFKSNDPKYSFLQYDSEGNVIKTVEKQAISSDAICGAYYFKNKQIFESCVEEYLKNCCYQEYFVSGVYNVMIQRQMKVTGISVDQHVPFGTPDEYVNAKKTNAFGGLE